MSCLSKRRVNRTEIDAILASCGIGSARIRSVEELSEGTFSAVYRIGLPDGTGLMLKVSPRPGTPVLRYEQGLMHGEVAFYSSAAGLPGVPVPAVLHADFDHAVIDGDVLVMSECPGVSWQSRRDRLDQRDLARLRGDLGRMVAALHRVTGPGFGYPRDASTSLAASWRTSFVAMFDAVCQDATWYAAQTPLGIDELANLVRRNADLLDDVQTPALVHFDLWNGNILLDFSGGGPQVGGLIDGERAFWGDPVADFVSLALFDNIENDAAFLAGYRNAGGRVVFDDRTRRRLALYRCYLYLIMLVESVPRGYAGAKHAKMHRLVSDLLLAESAALAAGPRSSRR